jgi:hypothetical protein
VMKRIGMTHSAEMISNIHSCHSATRSVTTSFTGSLGQDEDTERSREDTEDKKIHRKGASRHALTLLHGFAPSRNLAAF